MVQNDREIAAMAAVSLLKYNKEVFSLMKNFIDHIKQVAKADVHRYFEPFVSIWVAVHKNIARSARRHDRLKNKSK